MHDVLKLSLPDRTEDIPLSCGAWARVQCPESMLLSVFIGNLTPLLLHLLFDLLLEHISSLVDHFEVLLDFLHLAVGPEVVSHPERGLSRGLLQAEERPQLGELIVVGRGVTSGACVSGGAPRVGGGRFG